MKQTRELKIFSFIGIVAAALAVAGCGSGAKNGASAANTFVEGEFVIIPPPNAVHAGAVRLTAKNAGGEVHELVIVRAASAKSLALKSDGSVDESKISPSDKVGEITDVGAHSSKSATFELTPGTYVAFCNIVDTMMGSTATTMMMGSTATTMMMGSTATTMMTGVTTTANDTGMDSGMGHVHFAKGMHAVFTVS
jgi:hypothetical protein